MASAKTKGSSPASSLKEDFELYFFLAVVLSFVVTLLVWIGYSGWHSVCSISIAADGKRCELPTRGRGGLK